VNCHKRVVGVYIEMAFCYRAKTALAERVVTATITEENTIDVVDSLYINDELYERGVITGHVNRVIDGVKSKFYELNLINRNGHHLLSGTRGEFTVFSEYSRCGKYNSILRIIFTNHTEKTYKGVSLLS
jgi:hypothetical protein